MKTIRNIFFGLAAAVLSLGSLVSCDEWLEATSSTQLPVDKLLQTKSGFYDALTGIYISLGDANLYGGAYTWKINDLAAYPYIQQRASNYYPWQTHQYRSGDGKATLSMMWKAGYSTVANINLLLRELEARRNVVPYEPEYKMIKGELLALRALIHFDMVRMFGVSDWNGENAGKLTIPYVREYKKEPEAQRTYAETEKLILADLEAALDCLKEDPVTGKEDPLFQTSANVEGYWNNRAKHMNWFAVNAELARFWQWKHDYAKAAEYAQVVIDGAFARNLVKWVNLDEILTGADDNMKDWAFSCEQVFSLEVTRLQDYVRDYVMSSLATSGMRISQEFVETVLFPPVDPVTGSVAGSEDVRGPAFQLRFNSLGYSCYKLYGSSSYSEKYRNRIPMIRISEMYYILAENEIALGNKAKALEILDLVRKHRGIGDNLLPETDPADALMKEYYREFVFEGQLFYYQKHMKVTESLWKDFEVDEKALIYPYPDEEVNYGRKQEL